MKLNAKYVIPSVLTLILLSVYVFYKGGEGRKEEMEIKFQPRVERVEAVADINKSTVKEIAKKGLSLKLAKEVVAYREYTGVIENLDELERIKGIGAKTVEKLKDKFCVAQEEKKRKNKLNINNADEKKLMWYGFDKKEIKKVEEFRKKNGRFYSNVELLDLLGREKYSEISKNIIYKSVKKN